MQKQFKIIAIAGMIAIIAGIAGATAIEQAQAQQAATNPVNPNAGVAKAYGTKTAGVVCGDTLCGDVARVGEQTGAAAYASVKRIPWLASRSI